MLWDMLLDIFLAMLTFYASIAALTWVVLLMIGLLGDALIPEKAKRDCAGYSARDFALQLGWLAALCWPLWVPQTFLDVMFGVKRK